VPWRLANFAGGYNVWTMRKTMSVTSTWTDITLASTQPDPASMALGTANSVPLGSSVTGELLIMR